jgi:hypothetical protein
MKISLTLPDPAMPRTVFYDRLCRAIERNPRYVAAESDADVLLPAEDVALETNWPRYGDPGSAFIRGQLDWNAYRHYLDRLAAISRPLCIISMNPFAQLPVAFAKLGNVIVAALSLSNWQRALNPRTISMPALPIISGQASTPSSPRDVLASFRGAGSHPCRTEVAALHDGANFICELVNPANHIGRIDATSGSLDTHYASLLARSVFTFVPRGDALFSYRLLEALSFGCIPIILSDGWVLPFHRQIDWTAAALLIPEREVREVPERLRRFSHHRIAQLQAQVQSIHQRHFATLEAVVESMLRETETMFTPVG